MSKKYNYAKSFGAIIRANGQPHLNDYQYRRMWNIVCMDYYLAALYRAKELYANTEYFNRLDLEIFQASKKLTDLTGNLSPEELMIELHKHSQ